MPHALSIIFEYLVCLFDVTCLFQTKDNQIVRLSEDPMEPQTWTES